MYNIILAGVGGQGIVLASRIISTSAMLSGKYVLASETIGMAQRGGSVVSHIRISDEKTSASPLVPPKSADIVIAFELAEGIRMLPYLKDGGKIVVSTGKIKPTTPYEYDSEKLVSFLLESGVTVKLVDGESVCEALGNHQVLNSVLLGSAEEYLLLEHIEKAMEQRIKPQYINLNKDAYERGKAL